DWLVVGRYWKNSPGSPATPVARSDSTSSVLPLRCDASTRYAEYVMCANLTVFVFDAAFRGDRGSAGQCPTVDTFIGLGVALRDSRSREFRWNDVVGLLPP